MPQKKFILSAKVSSNNSLAIQPVLESLIRNKGTIKVTDDGFEIQAELEGDSARDLNRVLLTEIRKLEKRTRLRAEWSSGGTVEKFFDYVPKGIRKLD